jgi:hypothetical protein
LVFWSLTAKAKSRKFHILSLGLELLWLGGTDNLLIGAIGIKSYPALALLSPGSGYVDMLINLWGCRWGILRKYQYYSKNCPKY